MSHILSSRFNTKQASYSGPARYALCGGLILGALGGCAGTAERQAASLDHSTEIGVSAAVAEQNSVATRPEAVPESLEPIQPPTVTDARPAQNHPDTENRSNNITKDEDMTVLVLDNPELLAKAARLNSGPADLVPTVRDTPRKPHRSRFHYGFDKHRLSDEDKEILRGHAAYLKARPEVTLHIHGHTDVLGNEEYNVFLARLRANSAAKLLRAEGVEASRITVSSWGSRKPLTRPEDHAANRRLELEYNSEQMAKAQ
jgi:peptidoglycan-associated lipoprotein